MRSIRISAVAALTLLAAYSVLRAIAGQCDGAQCDAYVLPSIALPILVIAAVGVTGVLAILGARPAGGSWLVILIVTTALGVLGPPIAVAIFRDQPDTFVMTATVLLVQGPVAALVFTFNESPRLTQ